VFGFQSNAAKDYTTAIGYQAVANVAGTTTQGIISVGHKKNDPKGAAAGGGNYTSDYFSRIINVATAVDDNDAVNYGQLKSYVAANAGSSYSAGTGISLSGTKFSLNSTYMSNNYYRKEDLGGGQVIDFARYFKTEKFGENERFLGVINDNFATNLPSNLTSKIGGFATNHPPRLGAFAKCEKACSRLSERFLAKLRKNLAFEDIASADAGTFLFVSQTHKNVMDNFSQLTANGNFHLVNDGIFSNQSTCRAANDNSSIISNNSNDKTGVFGAPTVAGTTLNGRRRFNVMIADFLQNAQFMAVANDNFAITTFLRAI
jgi:hypothetical protein